MDYAELPYMLYADEKGRVYDHPYYRMAGFSGDCPVHIKAGELLPLPEFSKLFYIPDSHPVGLDPETGEYLIVEDIETENGISPCFAVSAFMEPGIVRTLLPAADYSLKSYLLPTWAYTAVGFKDGKYRAAGLWIEYNKRWDPRNYDDTDLVPAIENYKKNHMCKGLVAHLIDCATDNHCFAAKNLFLERWEAPIPVSRQCNASCLGCLSLQPDSGFCASHYRISERPSKDEIVSLAVSHLDKAPVPIVSFGQGCEGEPLTEHRLIAESIREIRKRTKRGTINLNTNGSMPEQLRIIIESGLDSVRISMNSARPSFYHRYYRPKTYTFDDVIQSILISGELGVYTMVNYLVFPGITDQKEEVAALKTLLKETGVNFLHLKNLCIDPQLYINRMPPCHFPGMGIKNMIEEIKDSFPDLTVGYFNQPVQDARPEKRGCF